MGSRSKGNYTNPCLTLHQPWASLLVYGIKRVEGRSWPAPLRGNFGNAPCLVVPHHSQFILKIQEFESSTCW